MATETKLGSSTDPAPFLVMILALAAAKLNELLLEIVRDVFVVVFCTLPPIE